MTDIDDSTYACRCIALAPTTIGLHERIEASARADLRIHDSVSFAG